MLKQTHKVSPYIPKIIDVLLPTNSSCLKVARDYLLGGEVGVDHKTMVISSRVPSIAIREKSRVGYPSGNKPDGQIISLSNLKAIIEALCRNSICPVHYPWAWNS